MEDVPEVMNVPSPMTTHVPRKEKVVGARRRVKVKVKEKVKEKEKIEEDLRQETAAMIAGRDRREVNLLQAKRINLCATLG